MVDRYWLKNWATSLILVWLHYQPALGHLRLPLLQLFPISARTNNCWRGVILLRYHRLIWCESGLRLNKQTYRDQPVKRKKKKEGKQERGKEISKCKTEQEGEREREKNVYLVSWVPAPHHYNLSHTSYFLPFYLWHTPSVSHHVKPQYKYSTRPVQCTGHFVLKIQP